MVEKRIITGKIYVISDNPVVLALGSDPIKWYYENCGWGRSRWSEVRYRGFGPHEYVRIDTRFCRDSGKGIWGAYILKKIKTYFSGLHWQIELKVIKFLLKYDN